MVSVEIPGGIEDTRSHGRGRNLTWLADASGENVTPCADIEATVRKLRVVSVAALSATKERRAISKPQIARRRVTENSGVVGVV